ncbi:MAG: hypothetical protein IK064_03855 [Clostridia bacterium]|nr:hypothetical protein [Clostridia bacterium]
MKKKLERYVKKEFSRYKPTAERNRLRTEMTQNLIDRYDEELAAGKSGTVALEAAKASLGDIDELTSSCGVEKKRFPSTAQLLYPLITIALMIAVAMIDFDTARVWCTAAVLLVVALFSLIIFPRTSGKWKIVAAVIYALICGALILLPFILKTGGRAPEDRLKTLDFTGNMDEIVSIKLITAAKPSDDPDDFEYTVDTDFPKEQWKELLAAVKRLEYSDFEKTRQELSSVSAGERMIRIFISGSDASDSIYLIRQSGPCLINNDKTGRAVLTRTSFCDPALWEEFIGSCSGG